MRRWGAQRLEWYLLSVKALELLLGLLGEADGPLRMFQVTGHLLSD